MSQHTQKNQENTTKQQQYELANNQGASGMDETLKKQKLIWNGPSTFAAKVVAIGEKL